MLVFHKILPHLLGIYTLKALVWSNDVSEVEKLFVAELCRLKMSLKVTKNTVAL